MEREWKTKVWTEWVDSAEGITPLTHWELICDDGALARLAGEEIPYPITTKEGGRWKLRWTTYEIPTDKQYKEFKRKIAETEKQVKRMKYIIQALKEEE